MTVLSIGSVVLVPIVAAFAFLCNIYAKRGLRRLAEYEHISTRFFDAMEILLAERDTPEPIVDCLDLLNSLITDEKKAKQFFESYCRLAYRRIESGDRSRPPEEYVRFVNEHPKLEQVVQDALICGLVALSYLSDSWGERYRAMLADLIARDRRPAIVIDAVRQTSHGGFFPGAAAA